MFFFRIENLLTTGGESSSAPDPLVRLFVCPRWPTRGSAAGQGALVAQTPQYDLILKGGHVIDPKNGVDGIEDVAVAGGRIAAVAANIPASAAKKTIDVAGLYVTPGLVDMHVHVFAGYTPGVVAEGMMSMMPDHLGFRAGVTTMVDAVSYGAAL
jgi:dihydroorotase